MFLRRQIKEFFFSQQNTTMVHVHHLKDTSVVFTMEMPG